MSKKDERLDYRIAYKPIADDLRIQGILDDIVDMYANKTNVFDIAWQEGFMSLETVEYTLSMVRRRSYEEDVLNREWRSTLIHSERFVLMRNYYDLLLFGDRSDFRLITGYIMLLFGSALLSTVTNPTDYELDAYLKDTSYRIFKRKSVSGELRQAPALFRACFGYMDTKSPESLRIGDFRAYREIYHKEADQENAAFLNGGRIPIAATFYDLPFERVPKACEIHYDKAVYYLTRPYADTVVKYSSISVDRMPAHFISWAAETFHVFYEYSESFRRLFYKACEDMPETYHPREHHSLEDLAKGYEDVLAKCVNFDQIKSRSRGYRTLEWRSDAEKE
ncbi:hypothetical protein D6833_02960 [Candidatus Parcubacteria bacterium]|nr:MAG: hypothetical protein D6833_02960 [Candidatus Parcubacteria bacterium]